MNLTIITSKPGKLVVKGDSLKNLSTGKLVTVERNKKPLQVIAYNDSVKKIVNVKSMNSIAYWLNFYPSVFTIPGLIIDAKKPVRYSYPRTIYIDLLKNDNKYLPYRPLDSKNEKYSNILKFTPLKLIGLDNSAMELSYERRTGHSLSIQFMASYLLSKNVLDYGSLNPQIKGYNFSIEEKYYFKKSALQGPYIGFEISYMKSQYKDVASFGPKHSYSDTTAYKYYLDTFGVKKQTLSFNLKLGYQIINKRLSVDFYVGIGPRYKNVIQFDRQNPDDVMQSPIDINFYYIRNQEGKYWTVSLPLNLKIGWSF